MLRRILPQAKQLAEEVIQLGDTVVDATCGNGHDTKFLSECTGETGKVYSFDVQAQALDNARALCESKNNIEFILDSHAFVDSYIKDASVKAAMFNLGYLPKGDHTITTSHDSTLPAIDKIFNLLDDGGRIIIVVYHGHPAGKIEKDALLDALSKWPQKEAQILKYQFINQKNDAPFIICIEKNRNA
ncbi:class I SAM-dependent methyltransferase [Salinicoccus hispanicus]|uniref:Methyltransferase domain-containing protein n=1 Tax=Salinicoccus hispanicus TaxID=157225 RepID=A0A6N8U4I9_9STAP|nr:class I SAM-dependent methyltransferase [Salinicoccus hispanicus]MXQ50529.1 methyltransferase domain-containing protein [Salinicoccus hispanicus]